MTNFEWILKMNKNEMAKFIDDVNGCSFCPENKNTVGACDEKCEQHASEWLEQEHIEPLKECPFCGGHAIIVKTPQEYKAQCCRCGIKTGYYSEEQDAVKAWNRRTE